MYEYITCIFKQTPINNKTRTHEHKKPDKQEKQRNNKQENNIEEHKVRKQENANNKNRELDIGEPETITNTQRRKTQEQREHEQHNVRTYTDGYTKRCTTCSHTTTQMCTHVNNTRTHTTHGHKHVHKSCTYKVQKTLPR